MKYFTFVLVFYLCISLITSLKVANKDDPFFQAEPEMYTLKGN